MKSVLDVSLSAQREHAIARGDSALEPVRAPVEPTQGKPGKYLTISEGKMRAIRPGQTPELVSQVYDFFGKPMDARTGHGDERGAVQIATAEYGHHVTHNINQRGARVFEVGPFHVGDVDVRAIYFREGSRVYNPIFEIGDGDWPAMLSGRQLAQALQDGELAYHSGGKEVKPKIFLRALHELMLAQPARDITKEYVTNMQEAVLSTFVPVTEKLRRNKAGRQFFNDLVDCVRQEYPLAYEALAEARTDYVCRQRLPHGTSLYRLVRGIEDELASEVFVDQIWNELDSVNPTLQTVREKIAERARARTKESSFAKKAVVGIAAGLMLVPALGTSVNATHNATPHSITDLTHAVNGAESQITNATNDGAVTDAEIAGLQSYANEIMVGADAALGAGAAWNELQDVLGKIQANLSMLETRGGQAAGIEGNASLEQALWALRDEHFPALNNTLARTGLIPAGGIGAWPAINGSLSSGLNITRLTREVVSWAYDAYNWYLNVLATKGPRPEQINFSDDFSSGGILNRWNIDTGPAPGNGSWGLRSGGSFTDALALNSDNVTGWATAGSKFNVSLRDGKIVVKARVASDRAGSHPFARPILALYSDPANQIVLQHGLQADPDFDGGTYALETIKGGVSNFRRPVNLDLKTWHDVELVVDRGYAQLRVDGFNVSGFNLTNPDFIPSDVPLHVRFGIGGTGALPDQQLLVDRVDASGYVTVQHRMTTVDGISSLGQAPDVAGLKNYLTNLSKVAKFFGNWLSPQHPELRAESQQGGYWSEVLARFLPTRAGELSAFKPALEWPTGDIPYKEPDVTPPTVNGIFVRNVNYSEPAGIIVNASDIGAPDNFGVDHFLLTITDPAGRLEERVLSANEFGGAAMVFSNTTKIGKHTVSAIAYDNAGNPSELESATFQVFGDTTPPVLQQIDLEDSYEINTTANGRLNVTDGGPAALSGVNGTDGIVTLPDNSEETVFVDEHGNFSYTFKMAGDYNLAFRPRDKSGNIGELVARTVHIWEDKELPVISRISYNRTASAGTEQMVEWVAYDNQTGLSSLKFELFNGSTGLEDLLQTVPVEKIGSNLYRARFNATDGKYAFQIRVEDGRKNVRVESRQLTLTPPLDTTPPQISILEKPESLSANTDFGINFRVSDNSGTVSQVKVLVDGQEDFHLKYLANGSIRFSGKLASGRHGITIQAYDPSGNVATTDLVYDVHKAAQPQKTPPRDITLSSGWPCGALLLGGGVAAAFVGARYWPELAPRVRGWSRRLTETMSPKRLPSGARPPQTPAAPQAPPVQYYPAPPPQPEVIPPEQVAWQEEPRNIPSSITPPARPADPTPGTGDPVAGVRRLLEKSRPGGQSAQGEAPGGSNEPPKN